MVSSNYARATGMQLIQLDQPIGLQLACIGSKSMINYGTISTIMFGDKCFEEYFDVANIDYYDTILGTPFLRRLGIILDFTGPGSICMGTKTVPRQLLPTNARAKAKPTAIRGQPAKPSVGE